LGQQAKLVSNASPLGQEVCAACLLRSVNFCGALLADSPGEPCISQVPLLQHYGAAPARHMVYRAGEPLDGILAICDGWAARVSDLPNGRRQILSFLLPGDFVSFVAMFTDVFDIEAVTPLRYCYYNRASFEARLARPNVFRAWTAALLQEKKHADQLVIDLGRRSAEARIARLFLSLRDRLAARGMISGQSFAFPLRQQHIADATGLTPVYVNHVPAAFRQGGLITMADRSATIVDLAGLDRVADHN
jgi:CRP/FNR family transcriptional regulator, anaerobic regulatory protein